MVKSNAEKKKAKKLEWQLPELVKLAEVVVVEGQEPT